MKDSRPVMFGVGFVLVFTVFNVMYSVDPSNNNLREECIYDTNSID